MSFKAQTQENEKDVLEQRSSQQTPQNFGPSAHQTYPAAIIQRAQLDPRSLTPQEVLHLQSTIGNRAVGQLLTPATPNASHGSSRSAEQSKPSQSAFGIPIPVQRQEGMEEEEEEILQGKFTTSETPDQFQGDGGEAEDRNSMPRPLKAGLEALSRMDLSGVRVHHNSSKPAQLSALAYTQGQDIHVGPGQEKHLPQSAYPARWLQRAVGNQAVQHFIQAKLKVNEPGDQYEQEADQVARQVVNQLNAPSAQPVQRQDKVADEGLRMKPQIQRRADGSRAAMPDLETSIQQERGHGQPLSDSLRQPMEQAFGTDFSGVKIHTDASSDQLSRSFQARAFTTGQDIFLKQNEYNPSSRDGQELLAHELTHVVQQGGGQLQQGLIQAKNVTGTDYVSVEKITERFIRSIRRGDEYMLERWLIPVKFSPDRDQFAARVAHALRRRVKYRSDKGKMARGLVHQSPEIWSIYSEKLSEKWQEGQALNLVATLYRRKDAQAAKRWVMFIHFALPVSSKDFDEEEIEEIEEITVTDPKVTAREFIDRALAIAQNIPGQKGRRIVAYLELADVLGYPQFLGLWYYNPVAVRAFAKEGQKGQEEMFEKGGGFPLKGTLPEQWQFPEKWRKYPFIELLQEERLPDDDIKISLGALDEEITESIPLTGATISGSETISSEMWLDFKQHFRELVENDQHLYYQWTKHTEDDRGIFERL